MWFLNTNKNQLHVVIYTGQINVKFASAIHQKGNITDPLKLLNFLLPKLDGEARKSKLHLQRYITKTAYKIRKKKEKKTFPTTINDSKHLNYVEN